MREQKHLTRNENEYIPCIYIPTWEVDMSTKLRGRYNLEDLVAHIPEGYEASEVDWGEPVGKEIW